MAWDQLAHDQHHDGSVDFDVEVVDDDIGPSTRASEMRGQRL
jgi:hypothetical protein